MADHTLNLTLTPHQFYVLLALTDKNLHAYGIRNQVAYDSGGTLTIATGTLYHLLRRLVLEGLIQSIELTPGNDRGGTIYARYTLTNYGRYRLESEIKRLEHAAAQAHLKLGHKFGALNWRT
jgi:DNA-binding PadR family transcriptional regulator